MHSPALSLPTPATTFRSRRPLSHQPLLPLVPMVHPLHDNHVGSRRRLAKVYHRRRKRSPIEEPAAAVAVAADLRDETSPEEGSSGSCEDRTCAECSTSHTPLWRNGPAGTKSLCNACGLRYKKRSRASFKVCQSKGVEDRQDKKLFLRRGDFAGSEEIEAALSLMALSQGFTFPS